MSAVSSLGDEVTSHADRDYARRQMAMHAARNRSGLCHLDKSKVCSIAWRCGFEYRIDCCASFVKKRRSERSHSVQISCVSCAKHWAGLACGWDCVCRPNGDKAKQNQLPA